MNSGEKGEYFGLYLRGDMYKLLRTILFFFDAEKVQWVNADPAASMSEVAEATGVGRATLNRHFAGRADLVHALGVRCLDRWEQTQAGAGVAEATASGDATAIAACVETMMRSLSRDAEDFAFALTEH